MLVVSLETPLYDPLYAGRDDSWVVLVVLLLAHVGIGAAVGRAWVLALPVALSIAGFLLSGAEGLAWLALVLGAPVLVGATAAGRLVRRAAPRQHDALGLGFVAVALLGPAWAAVETAGAARTYRRPSSVSSRSRSASATSAQGPATRASSSRCVAARRC